jgi:ABC-type uncharacterized transport system ATPase subunit
LQISKNISLDKFQNLKGVLKAQMVENGTYRITASRDENVGKLLAALALTEDAQIEELRKEVRKLEDVFKSLTR